MRHLALFLLLLAFGIALHAAPVAPSAQMPEGSGPWVVRAWYPDRAGLNLLTRRTAPWQVNHREGYVVVEVRNRYEYQLLLPGRSGRACRPAQHSGLCLLPDGRGNRANP